MYTRPQNLDDAGQVLRDMVAELNRSLSSGPESANPTSRDIVFPVSSLLSYVSQYVDSEREMPKTSEEELEMFSSIFFGVPSNEEQFKKQILDNIRVSSSPIVGHCSYEINLKGVDLPGILKSIQRVIKNAIDRSLRSFNFTSITTALSKDLDAINKAVHFEGLINSKGNVIFRKDYSIYRGWKISDNLEKIRRAGDGREVYGLFPLYVLARGNRYYVKKDICRITEVEVPFKIKMEGDKVLYTRTGEVIVSYDPLVGIGRHPNSSLFSSATKGTLCVGNLGSLQYGSKEDLVEYLLSVEELLESPSLESAYTQIDISEYCYQNSSTPLWNVLDSEDDDDDDNNDIVDEDDYHDNSDVL